MNCSIYFEIQADEPNRAINFYKTVFGWRFERASEGLPIAYWRIDTGEAVGGGGLLQRPAQPPPQECGTNAFVCSFEVDSIDEVTKTVLAHGGQIALPAFDVKGRGRQGYFLDTEGNTFGVFQIDPSVE